MAIPWRAGDPPDKPTAEELAAVAPLHAVVESAEHTDPADPSREADERRPQPENDRPATEPCLRFDDPPRDRSENKALLFFALMLPAEIDDEEIGDALEKLDKLRRAGAPRWTIWVKVASTVFWCVVNMASLVIRKLSTRPKTK